MKNYTQFINEENSKSFFKDYNFNYDGPNDKIRDLVIEYKTKPAISTIENDLKNIKKRYDVGSIYNAFKPKKGILYYFVYGWDTGYNLYLTDDENSRYLETPFFDEPTGKHSKQRYEFDIDNNGKFKKIK